MSIRVVQGNARIFVHAGRRETTPDVEDHRVDLDRVDVARAGQQSHLDVVAPAAAHDQDLVGAGPHLMGNPVLRLDPQQSGGLLGEPR